MFKLISTFQMKFDFDQKKRMQLYRVLNKTTDEKRRGLKVLNVLDSLKKQEKKNSSMFKLYSHWIKQLNNGMRFSEAIKNYVPAAEAMLISANEKSGKISDGFKMALELAKQKKEFTKIIITALTLQIILFVLSILILSYFCISIIPVLANSIPIAKMSSRSLAVVSMSSNFYVWMPIFLLICFTVALATIWALPNYKSGLRKFLDQIPPFSIYRILVGVSFLNTLSALTKAKLKQNDALLEMKRFAQPYLVYRINKYLIAINNGKSLGQALISTKLDFPDEYVIKELAMYAESGNIDDAMQEVIYSLNEDGLELVNKQAGVLKTISFAWILTLIMILIISIFTFVMDLQASVQM